MAETGTPAVEDVQREILASPFHRWLGIRVVALGERSITVEVPWRDEFVSNPERGTAHGGVLAALADLAADWALVGTVGRAVPTLDLRLDYLRPARPGPLTAVGTVLKPGRHVAVSEAVVTGADGKIVAVGRGTFLAAAGGDGP
ncbi:thioesterase family protein [Actinomadura vinacea]|uniref:Medium/long-chain acyl-CoA thioesterase YigI n=1 Tax=Actinomadura vinacea TaxID=115336 RepID=A0ABN3JR39_9ACTN